MSRTPQSHFFLLLCSYIVFSALGLIAYASMIELTFGVEASSASVPDGKASDNPAEDGSGPLDKDKLGVHRINSRSPINESALLPRATIVRSVNVHQLNNAFRVVVATDGFAQFADFVLENPTRVVVDLFDIRHALKSRAIDCGRSTVRSVRIGKPSARVARIVLDIMGEVAYGVTREDTSLVISVGPARTEPTHANRIERVSVASSGTVVQNLRELRGTVRDQQSGVIVNAAVTLDDRQGHNYNSRTDEQGNFRFASIVPGAYNLEVTAEGFGKHTQPVDLTSVRALSLPITLQVVINERIEVQRENARISTEPDDNLSAITLTDKELEALPDDPEELLLVLREMAGVSSGQSGTVYIDGFREGGRLPPKRAIQMIRINLNPFSAEYSEPGRGRIEITTKPGSDRLHGEFSFNFNDESLNARNAFAPVRSPLQIRNYSGYLNGPIIQGRWDFMFYAGRWEQEHNSVINAVILNPTTLEPQSFATTVLTPSSSTNFSIRTNYLLTKKHTLGIGYNYLNEEAQNQGLQGGFDLPERAFNSKNRSDALRFSLTSLLSSRTVNQIRLQLRRHTIGEDSINKEPAILVLESFNSGGNQGSLFTDTVNDELQFTESLSFVHNKHTFKAGVLIDSVALKRNNYSNFTGTFVFGSDVERDENGLPIPGTAITPLEHYRRTLLELPGYHPSQFSINRGDPFAGFSQWETGWFLQDDWRITNRLALSYGFRHEFQTHLEDKLNFAPRFSLAWAPDRNRKSVIRIGSGIFYDFISTRITLDTILFDGNHQQHFVIQQPLFFRSIPSDFSDEIERLQSTRIKSSLNLPYSILSTVSYERQLPWKLFGSIGYTWQRGIHQLRTRNINAPTLGSARPFPTEGPILQFESTGLSTGHELKLAFRTDNRKRFSLFGNYVLSITRSDTDGAYLAPANSYDLSNEFGRANSDQRHRVFIGGTVSVPGGFRISPYVFLSSGRPFNITTGRDNNGDTLFTDRPAFARSDDPEAIVTRFGIFNPNPRPGDQIIPRNFGEGPGQVTVNLNASKTFNFNAPTPRQSVNPRSSGDLQSNLTDSNQVGVAQSSNGASAAAEGRPLHLTLGVNAENLFNHTNFASPNGILTSSFFGRANRALPSRRIELSLRFGF